MWSGLGRWVAEGVVGKIARPLSITQSSLFHHAAGLAAAHLTVLETCLLNIVAFNKALVTGPSLVWSRRDLWSCRFVPNVTAGWRREDACMH